MYQRTEFSDSRFNPPNPPDITADDIRRAIDNVIDAINAGEIWDENHEFKGEMIEEIELILLDADDDKLARIKDVRDLYIARYAASIVARNPQQYVINQEH